MKADIHWDTETGFTLMILSESQTESALLLMAKDHNMAAVNVMRDDKAEGSGTIISLRLFVAPKAIP